VKKVVIGAVLTLMSSFLIPSKVRAQQIQVHAVRSGGSGCPDGSAQISFTSDNSIFSVLYSVMNVDTNQNRDLNGSMNMGYLECSVDIGITIPMGMQLELTEVIYNGFMNLPDDKTYGTINSTQHFVGGTVDHAFGRVPGSMLIGGLSFIKKGPLSENVQFKTSYLQKGKNGLVTGKHISSCEGKADFKMKTQIKAHTFNLESLGSVVLDTADAEFGSQYQLALKPCDEINKRRIRICKKGTCPK
jgi:hypothetical protein